MKDSNEMVKSLFERREQYYAERRRKMHMVKRITPIMAGCFVMIVGIAIWNQKATTGQGGTEVLNPTEASSDIQVEDFTNSLQVEVEELEETTNGEQTTEEAVINNHEDYAADEHGEHVELIGAKEVPEYFSGSYIDNNGNFVIILTQDTLEHRVAVCEALGENVNDVVFRTGTYTRNYLMELQAKISNEMTNKEIPFVISSSLRDDTNRILVTVTTNNEAELEKVKALDTIGGAIEFQYRTNENIEDIIVEQKYE